MLAFSVCPFFTPLIAPDLQLPFFRDGIFSLAPGGELVRRFEWQVFWLIGFCLLPFSIQRSSAASLFLKSRRFLVCSAEPLCRVWFTALFLLPSSLYRLNFISFTHEAIPSSPANLFRVLSCLARFGDKLGGKFHGFFPHPSSSIFLLQTFAFSSFRSLAILYGFFFFLILTIDLQRRKLAFGFLPSPCRKTILLLWPLKLQRDITPLPLPPGFLDQHFPRFYGDWTSSLSFLFILWTPTLRPPFGDLPIYCSAFR